MNLKRENRGTETNAYKWPRKYAYIDCEEGKYPGRSLRIPIQWRQLKKKKHHEKPACIKVPINMSQFNKVNNSSTYIVHLFLKFI